MKRHLTLLLMLIAPCLVTAQEKNPYPCTVVPSELFHPADHVLDDDTHNGLRIAGSGTTLGVLVPLSSRDYQLILVRGGERIQAMKLETPEGKDFPRTPSFTLAEEGELAVLAVREFIAVFEDAELATVVQPPEAVLAASADRGSLYWSSIPNEHQVVTGLMSSGGIEAVEQYVSGTAGKHAIRLLNDRPIPLLVRADTDGSDREVLLELDGSSLGEGQTALTHMLSFAVASNGKIWAAGRLSGKVTVLRPSGAIEDDALLPESLKLEGNQPEIQERREQEFEASLQAEQQEDEANRGSNAQRSGEPDVIRLAKTPSTPWFHAIMARDRDLLMVPATIDPPPGSILVFDDPNAAPRCLQLHDAFVQKPLSSQFAATDDAVWLREPFGYFLWTDLHSLLHPDPEMATSPP